jgi:phage gp46-like protein
MVGALQRDPANGLLNAAYLRLTTPLGSWFGDATVGSRLYELSREKDLVRVARLAQQYATDALQPLIADGRAQSVDVRTFHVATGQLAITVEIVDAHGVQSSFDLPVKVV